MYDSAFVPRRIGSGGLRDIGGNITKNQTTTFSNGTFGTSSGSLGTWPSLGGLRRSFHGKKTPKAPNPGRGCVMWPAVGVPYAYRGNRAENWLSQVVVQYSHSQRPSTMGKNPHPWCKLITGPCLGWFMFSRPPT